MSLARQRIAITSLAAVMSKPLSRGMPSERPPSPMMMSRSARSFMSITRFQVTRRGSSRDGLPLCSELSTSAASRLCALETAWKSPLKCRLMSIIGSISDAPPPAPPPFMPKTGPEARLAQRRRAVHADFREALDQADGGGGLALARRRGRDRRDQHELAAIRAALEGGQRQLGLVVAVRFEHGGINADGARDVADGFHQSFPLVRASRRPRVPPDVVVCVARSLAQCAATVDCGPYGWAVRGARAVAHERPGWP